MEGGASNLCFGEPDGLSVFITAGEQVFLVGLKASAPENASDSARK